VVENRDRKQTKNWKETVKWVVKGCGREKGREFIRWMMVKGIRCRNRVRPLLVDHFQFASSLSF
jgi:hypothetical protein